METILRSRGLNTIPRHLQTRAASIFTSQQPITPFITTLPSTIKRPILESPTPSQVIVDSIGNHGVITNQNLGHKLGGGVSVWYSKQKDNSAVESGGLSVSHANSLSHPVIQPSGDISGVGMAAPTGLLPVALPGGNTHGISTSNPFLQHDMLNSVTSNILMNSVQGHVTDRPIDFMFTTPTPSPLSNNLGKVISSLVDIALESMIHLLTPSFKSQPVAQNATGNLSKKAGNLTNILGNITTSNNIVLVTEIVSPLNVSSIVLNTTIVNNTTSVANVTDPMTKIHTTSIPFTTTVPTTTTISTTSTAAPTTTVTTQRTTTLSEDVIRLPDGRIITNAMLETMDPEQAELYAEMSERQV